MTAHREVKTVATLCMLHGRYPDSLKTVHSLEGQVDTLYLCLNDFWEVPPELKRDWIEILHLGENLGDAARFYLLRNSGPLDAHVISCDDDIEYPESYVEDFLTQHAKHPDALLTYGGETLHRAPNKIINYEQSMIVFRENQETLTLDAPGSGSSFIPKALFNQLEFTNLVHFNQSDIHLACNCRKLGAPIIGLPHAADYVRYIPPPQPAIYETITSKPDRLQKVEAIYQSYGLSLEAAAEERSPPPAEEHMQPPSAGEEKIVATMCMLDNRYPGSLKTVRSLEGQVGTLYLCLNGFSEVPPELKQDWIEILHLGENLGDAARFYLLRQLGPLEAHVISCDDDLVYPQNYVRDFLVAHRKYPDALLTYHGDTSRYDEEGKIEFIRTSYIKWDQQAAVRLAQPGSGVSFFPKSVFNRLEFTSLVHLNQADVHLACNCQKLEVPIISLPHKGGYVYPHNDSQEGSIFHTITDRSCRVEMARKIYASYGLEPVPPDQDITAPAEAGAPPEPADTAPAEASAAPEPESPPSAPEQVPPSAPDDQPPPAGYRVYLLPLMKLLRADLVRLVRLVRSFGRTLITQLRQIWSDSKPGNPPDRDRSGRR